MGKNVWRFNYAKSGFERLLSAIEGAATVAVGSPALLETHIVLTAKLGYVAQPASLIQSVERNPPGRAADIAASRGTHENRRYIPQFP